MAAHDDGGVPPLVRYEIRDAVAMITLDSPGNRNALSSRLQRELSTHVHAALDDDAVRVVVLTGTGSVFCSGGDLKERPGATGGMGTKIMEDVFATVWESPKPVVCRVNGHARAGGLGLIGACDIAVAPRSTTFGFAEVRIGVLPAMIAVTCLPRMNPRAALELLMTGATFDAVRAEEIGLVTRTVDDDGLDTEVDRIVEALLRGAPGALAGIKPMIQRIAGLPLRDGLAEMGRLSMERFASAEAQEGIGAFLEKRPPRWAVRP